MLMKDGYDVDCVYDGADGLNFASTGMYDIVLLDVMMPKLNGFEVLAKMRARKLETPVIMLTALTDEKTKSKGSTKARTITCQNHFLSTNSPHVYARCSEDAENSFRTTNSNIRTLHSISPLSRSRHRKALSI